MKHYWPYLPMVALVAVGLLVSSLWPKGVAVLGSSTDVSLSSLLDSSNQQRSLASEPALQLDTKLSRAAQAKANDMVQKNYWSHNTPSGATPWSFIDQAGYNYQKAGENLAYGFNSADDVTNAWMHSPEHRKNLLGISYSQVGFGVANSPDFDGHGPSTLVVAMYGQPTATVMPAVAYRQDSSPVPKPAQLQSEPVSRLAVLSSSQTSLATMAIASLMSLAVVLFVVRHGRLLHRSLVRGEAFVLHHPWLDMSLVVVATAGFILTRAAGVVL